MTPRELIRRTAESFRVRGIPDPEHDAALLLSHLTGRPALELRLDNGSVTDPDILAAYQELVQKRLCRIPLQYLLGEAPFLSRFFQVDPRVLIPRPETELLCEWALKVMEDQSSPRILDLCCGSGCIGLTLKAERPDAVVTLSDISSDALDVAAANAARLSLDVSICMSDLMEVFPCRSFDLIVSNPPYIPSPECECLQPEVMKEPRLALDGGTDGCDIYRRIIRSASEKLTTGGKLLMELGIHESGTVSSCLSAYGYSGIEVRKDYSGIDRMVLAVLP